MLELSRVTRRVLAARVRYQRLRSHELDLIKGLHTDEIELSTKHLNGIDLQIGSIRNLLQDGGVTAIGDQGGRFNPCDREPWCESSSDDESVPMIHGTPSHGSSACLSEVDG